jgi:hypothetical protein
MYEPSVKQQVLFILNQKRDLVSEYKAIFRPDWAIIKAQYIKLWKAGDKSPQIDPIDLKLYKKEQDDSKEAEIVTIAKEYFGDDIEIKG